ncbi:MAG: lysine--tRNA ligase [Methylacidiphilales bacterium]|nr:lysine--tRNA ligase [Candidatus Methylacidiphilales bacterium]MDW8349277.1 lysine--tRNA ligase [Verrucomicrobiae bacterium]
MHTPSSSPPEPELIRLRREKLKTWQSLGYDPFGQAYPGTSPIQKILDNFTPDAPAKAAGRLISFRDMGKSIFGHIQDETGRIQVYANPQSLGEKLEHFRLLDLADWIGVEGQLFVTKTGERTIRVTAFTLLGKAIRPLPSQWHGLNDPETRYRQRYLDMVINRSVTQTLITRSRIIKAIRNYLDERGFIEVETPMMQTIAGGAAAQPFLTHHNALNIPLFLRIAPELYLKRLLVGGFTKIYEINRNFRNEGISRKHNPEFTMLEAYWAYADYQIMAELLENLITHVAQTVIGSLIISPQKNDATSSSSTDTIDLTPPWPRKTYRQCILEVAGEDWYQLSIEEQRQRCTALGVDILPHHTPAEYTQLIFEKLVESRTVNPLFVTHLPKELVPLAKQNKDNPDVVDVFELIINRQEIAPGYTELNDPITQRRRLEEQVGEETQKIDEDFLLALEHGMPAAGGIGLGIDRLVMLLTGAESIRDVIAFPLLRPKP